MEKPGFVCAGRVYCCSFQPTLYLLWSKSSRTQKQLNQKPCNWFRNNRAATVTRLLEVHRIILIPVLPALGFYKIQMLCLCVFAWWQMPIGMVEPNQLSFVWYIYFYSDRATKKRLNFCRWYFYRQNRASTCYF